MKTYDQKDNRKQYMKYYALILCISILIHNLYNSLIHILKMTGNIYVFCSCNFVRDILSSKFVRSVKKQIWCQ